MKKLLILLIIIGSFCSNSAESGISTYAALDAAQQSQQTKALVEILSKRISALEEAQKKNNELLKELLEKLHHDCKDAIRQ